MPFVKATFTLDLYIILFFLCVIFDLEFSSIVIYFFGSFLILFISEKIYFENESTGIKFLFSIFSISLFIFGSIFRFF